MTVPLAILAFFAIALGVIGTPAWPWFHAFLERHAPHSICTDSPSRACCCSCSRRRWSSFSASASAGGSTATNRRSPKRPTLSKNPLPWLWAPLRDRLYVDEFYGVDRDRLLRMVGARGRLARSPRLGRHRRCRRVALRPLGAAQPPARRRLGRRRLRQNLRGDFYRRRPAGARARVAACKTTCAFWPSAVVALAAILIWSSRP